MAEEKKQTPDDDAEKNEAKDAPKPAGGIKSLFRNKWVWIGIAIFSLIMIGVVLGIFLLRDDSETEKEGMLPNSEEMPPTLPEETGIPGMEALPFDTILPLEPFIDIKLGDSRKERFLKTSIVLEFFSKSDREKIRLDPEPIRKIITLVIESKTSEELQAIPDKIAFKRELIMLINQNQKKVTLRNLYFTEFIILPPIIVPETGKNVNTAMEK